METNNNTNQCCMSPCLHNTVLDTMNQSSIDLRAQSSNAVLSDKDVSFLLSLYFQPLSGSAETAIDFPMSYLTEVSSAGEVKAEQ